MDQKFSLELIRIARAFLIIKDMINLYFVSVIAVLSFVIGIFLMLKMGIK